MTNTHHIKHIILSLLMCSLSMAISAQSVKEITVSHNTPYTDHISMRNDSKDMDLMAKFAFDEKTNTLTITLISYRDLFVFQTATTYKQAIKGRKLKPDKLPFVVDTDPMAKYELTKEYWEAIPKPKKKHVFKKWIEYSGLHPLPTDYKMVNDYVKQDFNILNKADAVSITLHDVLMIDQEASDGKPLSAKQYDVVWGKDLDITYRIYIDRDPCFGMEEEIEAAGKLLESITAGYKNLQARYESGFVGSRESLANFKEMQQLLLGQYPKKTEKNSCPNIQEKWDAYNLYIDSISNMKCRIRPAVASYRSNGATGGSYIGTRGGNVRRSSGEGIDAGYIMTQARRIDSAVARWLLTKDRTERADLKKQCQEIINLMKNTVAQKGIVGNAQRNALNIFNQAAAYYRSTCK